MATQRAILTYSSTLAELNAGNFFPFCQLSFVAIQSSKLLNYQNSNRENLKACMRLQGRMDFFKDWVNIMIIWKKQMHLLWSSEMFFHWMNSFLQGESSKTSQSIKSLFWAKKREGKWERRISQTSDFQFHGLHICRDHWKRGEPLCFCDVVKACISSGVQLSEHASWSSNCSFSLPQEHFRTLLTISLFFSFQQVVYYTSIIQVSFPGCAPIWLPYTCICIIISLHCHNISEIWHGEIERKKSDRKSWEGKWSWRNLVKTGLFHCLQSRSWVPWACLVQAKCTLFWLCI